MSVKYLFHELLWGGSGSVRGNFRGGRKPFPKPSAFESEIHPSHKTPFCTLGISPCRGQIHASVNLQSERLGLYLSMPPQRTGRMDAVATNGYIFGWIRSNIYGTSQKSLPAAARNRQS